MDDLTERFVNYVHADDIKNGGAEDSLVVVGEEQSE